MRYVFPLIRWFWLGVLVALGISIAVNLLFAPLRPEVVAFVVQSGHLIGVELSVLVILTVASWLYWRRDERERLKRRLRQEFALCKNVDDLTPEDLGFEVLETGQRPDDLRKRPFYPFYAHRSAAPQDAPGDTPLQYTEDDLVGSLRSGLGVLLVGPPLDGKSRTLYQVIASMDGYTVLMPLRDKPTPSHEAFSLLSRERVVLLVEDLNSYVGAAVDLIEFCARLDQHARTRVVAATCRDGPELGAVKESVGASLRRFYEDVPRKLRLLPLSDADRGNLARSIGSDWDPALVGFFPTPGSIAMARPLQAMRLRFDALSPERKDILRTVKLLAFAGVLPFTHRRLLAVLEHVFGRQVAHLSDHLDLLADQAFLERPSKQDPVQPEPAYILGTVSYGEGRRELDDLTALTNALVHSADAEGLLLLGNTYGLEARDHRRALECFELSTSVDRTYDRAWHNKGLALLHLDRHEDAVQAFDQAVALRPEFSESWCDRGAALAELGRLEEALNSLDRAVALTPRDVVPWSNRAFVLTKLHRHQEALGICPS